MSDHVTSKRGNVWGWMFWVRSLFGSSSRKHGRRSLFNRFFSLFGWSRGRSCLFAGPLKINTCETFHPFGLYNKQGFLWRTSRTYRNSAHQTASSWSLSMHIKECLLQGLVEVFGILDYQGRHPTQNQKGASYFRNITSIQKKRTQEVSWDGKLL